ncbi:polyketide synthase dehydratase domain-containing protein, partial [Streptacidiphilus carbonis]|uniref:polyketide synthase dehydratase domain-containing protein n=1 Tax=Streptacidiphilus carbonis TaxID=105422 RepID=UPI003F6F6EEE
MAEGADAAQLESWPPAGAVAQDPGGLYPALAAAGLSYGPLFQGVRTLWRRGDEVFAEVALADDTPVAGFAVHPALLDSALHPISATDGLSGQHGPLLPFAWTDIVVHATGARAARVRLTPAPTGDGVSLTLADETGALIASVGGLVLRPLPMAESASSTVADEALFTLDWVPSKSSNEPEDLNRWAALCPESPSFFGEIPHAVAYSGISELTAAVADGRLAPDTVIIGCPTQSAGPGVGDRTLAAAVRALSIVQEWLAADNLAEARLVLVTERAVDAGSGDVPVEVTSSGIWGLVRVAASENPGRLGLVDLDLALGSDGAGELVRAAVSTGEVQVAVRAGELLVPRLVRVRSVAALAIPANSDAWRL